MLEGQGPASLSIMASVPLPVSALVELQHAVRDIAVAALESRQPAGLSLTSENLLVRCRILLAIAFIPRGGR